MNDKVVADDAVTDPKDTAEQESAQTDEKPLDQLLEEFNSEFDEDTKPEDDVKPDDIEQVKEFMTEYRHEQTDKAVSQAAQTVVKALGEDLPVQVTEDMVTDLLYGRASRDKRFLTAFVNRGKDPKAWNQVLGGVASKIKSDFGEPIDTEVTKDRQAVTQSIRGNSKTEDEAPDFSGWSDRRFNHWKQTGKDDPNL